MPGKPRAHTWIFMVNVGKYTIHGSYGLYRGERTSIDPKYQQDIPIFFHMFTGTTIPFGNAGPIHYEKTELWMPQPNWGKLPYLEDHPMTGKWLIIMVVKSPK